MNNKNCDKCLFYSGCFEMIANRYSLLYTVSIFLSISLSVILLTKLVKNETSVIILGLSSVIFAIVPLVLKEKIEKVHGYNSLAKEFETLEQSFKENGNDQKNLSKLKELTLKTSDYQIDSWTKWRINRKNAKK